MKSLFSVQPANPTPVRIPMENLARCGVHLGFSLILLALCAAARAQIITINTNGGATAGIAGTVDRRFAQIEPTKVDLPKTQLDPKTRYELLRFLQADQGFAMRPLPRGHKGLTLAANGLLEPAGEAYLSMVTDQGLSAKPGDRVVITDIKFDKSRVTFMLNGGPDAKHRFLRHIQLGTGTTMSSPVQDDGSEATGSRITLTFRGPVPEMTGKQVEQLLSPLISFEVKTPIQAFTDTLPPKLKTAILDHQVLVGMSTDMVLFAMGKPESKIREMDGQMPFEEWIYGKPPQDVQFVRINGNRVIRVEVAKMGKAPEIFTKDEVEGMMRTDGTPLIAGDAPGTRTVEIGDVQRDPDKQAPAAPPSLRMPGEAAPTPLPGATNGVGTMKPVQFPKQAPDDHPVAHQGQQQPANGSQASPQNQGQGTNGSSSSPAPQSNAGSSSDSNPPRSQPSSGQAPSTNTDQQPN